MVARTPLTGAFALGEPASISWPRDWSPFPGPRRELPRRRRPSDHLGVRGEASPAPSERPISNTISLPTSVAGVSPPASAPMFAGNVGNVIEQVPFGSTDHLSSRAIFGAAAFSRVPQDRADAVLPILDEFGVNHIDVAASYGDAELRLAPWMR